METKFFRNQTELREWFAGNHDKLSEAWIGYYKKNTEKESIGWDDSVEVAICFGWIDGIRKSIDTESYKIRFTPRNPRSNWSHKNIRTAEKMIREGRMTPAGMEAFRNRQEANSAADSFEKENAGFSKPFESDFKKNKKAWAFFISQAAYYRRVTARWVMSAKQEKTRIKRMKTLIEDSENQVRIKAMR